MMMSTYIPVLLWIEYLKLSNGTHVLLFILLPYSCSLSNPCEADGVVCQPTYSFRHTLSLTSDANLFDVRKYTSVLLNLP